jgi:AmiR/NasT family two-component response regulator
MSQPTRPLRIAVADDEPETRDFFREVLAHLGHQVVVAADTGRQLVEQCRTIHPDLVITDIKMPDLDGIEAAAALNQERQVPVILVTAHPGVDFLARAGEGHIMAHLAKPIKPVDLQMAIALAVMRFDQFQKVSQEAVSLRQALEDRKVIERAKGDVMKRVRVDEAEAFRRLRKLASDQNRKLVEVARTILAAEELFQALEKV